MVGKIGCSHLYLVLFCSMFPLKCSSNTSPFPIAHDENETIQISINGQFFLLPTTKTGRGSPFTALTSKCGSFYSYSEAFIPKTNIEAKVMLMVYGEMGPPGAHYWLPSRVKGTRRIWKDEDFSEALLPVPTLAGCTCGLSSDPTRVYEADCWMTYLFVCRLIDPEAGSVAPLEYPIAVKIYTNGIQSAIPIQLTSTLPATTINPSPTTTSTTTLNSAHTTSGVPQSRLTLCSSMSTATLPYTTHTTHAPTESNSSTTTNGRMSSVREPSTLESIHQPTQLTPSFSCVENTIEIMNDLVSNSNADSGNFLGSAFTQMDEYITFIGSGSYYGTQITSEEHRTVIASDTFETVVLSEGYRPHSASEYNGGLHSASEYNGPHMSSEDNGDYGTVSTIDDYSGLVFASGYFERLSTSEDYNGASTTRYSKQVSGSDYETNSLGIHHSVLPQPSTQTPSTSRPTSGLTYSQTTHGNQVCPCMCTNSKHLTAQMIRELTTTIRKNLTVDTSSLSSTIRAKTSAYDSRPSSKLTGILGVVFLVLIFGSIVIIDLINLFVHLLCSL